jgi:hypothetical protein
MTLPVAVFIDPPSHHFLGDRLFDSSNTRFGGEDLLAPHIAVRDHFGNRGIPVHTADLLPRYRADRNLLVSLGRTEAAGQFAGDASVVASAFFAMECPIVEPLLYRALPAMAARFRRLYCWTDRETLAPFTGAPLHPQRFWWPQSFDAVREEHWSRGDRGFLVMINANKLPRVYDRELYTARLEGVAYFHRYGEIDLYGKNWDRMPNRVGRTSIPATARRLYGWAWRHWQRVRPNPWYQAAREANRGPVDSKLATLAQYRFALCFENMALRGWITEKLFDCLCAGTIPVYWGATDIEHWVDPDCFIDMRRFADFTELRGYLHAVPGDELARRREAGRRFLASPAFDRFRRKAWVDRFRTIVREDAGVET